MSEYTNEEERNPVQSNQLRDELVNNSKDELIGNIVLHNNQLLEVESSKILNNEKPPTNQITFESSITENQNLEPLNKKEDEVQENTLNEIIKSTFNDNIMYSPIKHEKENKDIINEIITEIEGIAYLSPEQTIRIYRNIIPIIEYIKIDIFEQKIFSKLQKYPINQGKYFNSSFIILQQTLIQLFDELNGHEVNKEGDKKSLCSRYIKIVFDLLENYFNKKPQETLSTFVYGGFKSNINIFEEEFPNLVRLEMYILKIRLLNYKIYKEIMKCKDYIEKSKRIKLIEEFNNLNILIDKNKTFYLNYTEDFAFIKGFTKLEIIIKDTENESLSNKLEKLNISEEEIEVESKICLLKSINTRISIGKQFIELFDGEIVRGSFFDILEVSNSAYENIIENIKITLNNDTQVNDVYDYLIIRKLDILNSIFDEELLENTLGHIIKRPTEYYEKIQIFDIKNRILNRIINEHDFYITKSFTELLSFLLPTQIQMFNEAFSENRDSLYKLRNKQIEKILNSFHEIDFTYANIFQYHFNMNERLRSFYHILESIINSCKLIDFEFYQIFIQSLNIFVIEKQENILNLLINEMKARCDHVLKEIDSEVLIDENSIKLESLEEKYRKIKNFECSEDCAIYTVFLIFRLYFLRDFKAVLDSKDIVEFKAVFLYFSCSKLFGTQFYNHLIQLVVKKIEGINEFRKKKFKFKLGEKKSKENEILSPNKLMSFMDKLLFIKSSIKYNEERDDLILLHWRDYIELMKFLFEKIDKQKFKELFSKCPVKSIQREYNSLLK